MPREKGGGGGGGVNCLWKIFANFDGRVKDNGELIN